MIYKQSVFEPWAIESESVQAVITSPPYYALRKYSIPDVIIGGNKDCKHEFGSESIERKRGNVSGRTAQCGVQKTGICGISVNHGSICLHCQAWKGQYGLEPHYSDYVEHTRLWAKEAWRVLRNDGIFFLNIADSYAGSGGAGGDYNKGGLREGQEKYKQNKINYLSKCQLLIPHRVAISLVDSGWTLRNTIIWFKGNAMPESVTDRFSKKYEYIFMFTKQSDYYFNLAAVKEPLKETTIQRIKYLHGQDGEKHSELRKVSGKPQGDYSHLKDKNPGDVWIIPTQPSSEKHFAMWPEQLVERMIRCSTRPPREIKGELLIDAVLDPFCGSGTTLKVAQQLCREPLGIDLGYHEISKRRTSKIQKEMFI